MKFEYHIVVSEGCAAPAVLGQEDLELARLGAEGWELVAVVHSPLTVLVPGAIHKRLFYFKRAA